MATARSARTKVKPAEAAGERKTRTFRKTLPYNGRQLALDRWVQACLTEVRADGERPVRFAYEPHPREIRGPLPAQVDFTLTVEVEEA